MNEIEARRKLLKAALRVLYAHVQDEDWAYADAEAELADEQLALAARDLVRAVEASNRKPVGWRDGNEGIANLAGSIDALLADWDRPWGRIYVTPMEGRLCDIMNRAANLLRQIRSQA